MLTRSINYLRRFIGVESLIVNDMLTMGLVRGQVSCQCRIINDKNPQSWEFSGFSQNGEDGIIDFLTRKMLTHNNYFIEIGAGSGLENNTAWLAFGRKWAGIMIDGDVNSVNFCKKLVAKTSRVECFNYFVSLDNIHDLLKTFHSIEPDIFSLDIDGNDYYIMNELLSNGFRPGIAIVEYNSALGPHDALVLKYDKNFRYQVPLNFGTSIQAWKKLFFKFNYKFISVDSNGINAFFVNPGLFQPDFLKDINGTDFSENIYMKREYKAGWESQVKLIHSDLFTKIEELP